MNAWRFILLSLFLYNSACFAQKKIPVEVAHVGEDSVGYIVAQELRDAIRGSQGILVMPEPQEAIAHSYGLWLTVELGRPRIKLQLVTPKASSPGRDTPIAVNIVYDSADMPLGGAFIRSVVEVCGEENARSCASRILETANRSVEWLRQNWPSVWKTL